MPGGWRADICVNRHRIFIGVFGSEERAARAWDAVAVRECGEFARLNFPHAEFVLARS